MFRIISSLLIILLITLKCFAQTSISDDEKNKLLSMLTSSDKFIRLGAAMEIQERNIKEAIPILERDFFNQDPYMMEAYLDVLQHLKAPNIKEILHAYIDSADVKGDEDWTPLSMKAEATYTLFHMNDFSTVGCAIESLEKDFSDKATDAVLLADTIVALFPEYRERVKTALYNQVKRNSDDYNRCSSMMTLVDKFGKEVLPSVINVFVNDKTPSTRAIAFDYLEDWDYPSLDSLVKIQVYKEEYGYIRSQMLRGMLKKHPTVENYEFVKNYAPNESESNEKEVLLWDMRAYVPGKPSTTLPVLEMISNLENTTNEVFQRNWIDTTTNRDLKGLLNSSKSYFQSNDLFSSAKEIRHFQNKVNYEYKDLQNLTSQFVTKDAWRFLYYDAGYLLDRLPLVPQSFNLNLNITGSGTVEKTPSQAEYDSSTTVTLSAKPAAGYVFKEWTGDITGTNAAISVVMNSNKNITASFIPVPSGITVKLINSSGSLLTGGGLQYYEGAWRDAVDNNNGTFTVNTTRPAISLRMTYEYGSQTKQNVPTGTGDIVFQTVNAQVKLQDSNSNLIDQGTVQYYAGAWRAFGTTSGGIASKELLPVNYSFRMTYAFGSNDKQQDLNSNPVVVFKTINVQVQLKNSLGSLIDAGTVQYYTGAWRTFGSTSSGTAVKELLPGNYSFRMTYEYVSNDKQQDISTNNVVSFQTILSTIRVKDAQNNPVNNAQVSYYAGAWRVIGNTVNGEVTKELLPAEISFRAKLGTKQTDKKQNIGTSNIVEISLP